MGRKAGGGDGTCLFLLPSLHARWAAGLDPTPPHLPHHAHTPACLRTGGRAGRRQTSTAPTWQEEGTCLLGEDKGWRTVYVRPSTAQYPAWRVPRLSLPAAA